MTLTFTLGAGVLVLQGENPDANELLLAIVGTNVAWGLIDAGLYVMTSMYDRSRKSRLISQIQKARNDQDAVAVVRQELADTLESITQTDRRERLFREIADSLKHAEPKRTRLTHDDIIGAIASFILVFLATIPAALPFMFVSDPVIALRISNLLLIAMLFFVGYRWAVATHTNRWIAGLTATVLGAIMVAIAIILEG